MTREKILELAHQLNCGSIPKPELITPADEEQLARIALLVDDVDPYEAPEGWRLVPIEPTEEMITAAENVNWADEDIRGSIINMWYVMLAAAPEYKEQK